MLLCFDKGRLEGNWARKLRPHFAPYHPAKITAGMQKCLSQFSWFYSEMRGHVTGLLLLPNNYASMLAVAHARVRYK